MTAGCRALSPAQKAQYQQQGFLTGRRIFDYAPARAHIDLFAHHQAASDYHQPLIAKGGTVFNGGRRPGGLYKYPARSPPQPHNPNA